MLVRSERGIAVRLWMSAVVQTIAGLVGLGVLLFLPAGTFGYWQGWLFLITFAVVSAVMSCYLYATDRAAFERRMRSGQESRPVQRAVIALLFVSFLAMLVVGGLDFRFGWSHMPTAVVVLGDVLLVVGLVLAMAVVIQNRYAAANVAVEEGQRVVSTGFYAIVRHPMYLFSVVLIVGVPLVLGSWWALLLVIPQLLSLVLRVVDEERFLETELAGYTEYQQKTRYRVIPYVW